MNIRIKKVMVEMKKVEDKIEDLQSKWRELNKQKTDFENIEIVSIVRGAKISTDNLPKALQTYQKKEVFHNEEH